MKISRHRFGLPKERQSTEIYTQVGSELMGVVVLACDVEVGAESPNVEDQATESTRRC